MSSTSCAYLAFLSQDLGLVNDLVGMIANFCDRLGDLESEQLDTSVTAVMRT